MTATSPDISAGAPAPSEGDLDRAAEEAVKTVGIPPCPMILTGVVREMRADEPNFRRIASLIGTDVGLAATTIKTANSALFGLPRPVGTIQDAITYLGAQTVAQVVTGLLLRQAFAVSENAAMGKFWDRSARRATLAGALARRLRAAEPSLAYTFGLFRDCGMAIMLRKFKSYAELMGSEDTNGLLFIHLESERFALDHARVGRYLAQSWQLSAVLCDAIVHHHDADALRGAKPGLDPASARLVAVGALADHCAAGQGGASAETLLACAQLEVAAEQLEELAAELRAPH